MKSELCGHSSSSCGGRQAYYCTLLPLPVNVFRGDCRCDPDQRENSLVLSAWSSVVGQRIALEVVISMDMDNHTATSINTLRKKESKVVGCVLLFSVIGRKSYFLFSFTMAHKYLGKRLIHCLLCCQVNAVKKIIQACTGANLWKFSNCVNVDLTRQNPLMSVMLCGPPICLSILRVWQQHPDLLQAHSIQVRSCSTWRFPSLYVSSELHRTLPRKTTGYWKKPVCVCFSYGRHYNCLNDLKQDSTGTVRSWM